MAKIIDYEALIETVGRYQASLHRDFLTSDSPIRKVELNARRQETSHMLALMDKYIIGVEGECP